MTAEEYMKSKGIASTDYLCTLLDDYAEMKINKYRDRIKAEVDELLNSDRVCDIINGIPTT